MTVERTEKQMQAQAEIERRQREDCETCRIICDHVGLYLICPEGECRRAGHCAGPPSAKGFGNPFCFGHYREELRFLLASPYLIDTILEWADRPFDDPAMDYLEKPGGRAWVERVVTGGLMRTARAQGVSLDAVADIALGEEGRAEEYFRHVKAPEPRTLIEMIYGEDAPVLARLRRPRGVRGPGGWEIDPDGFAAYMAEGDWREPGRVGRPAPVCYYGRWVE